MKPKAKEIEVEGNISIFNHRSGDFISLTDIMNAKDGSFFISDWLRNANTLDCTSAWESMHNPGFNYGEFATIRKQAGSNAFKISVKEFIGKTNATCISIGQTGFPQIHQKNI